MNLSAFFINRPIATSMFAIGIAFAGFLSFYLLPVSSLPQVDFPTISVQASLPGANPETMASSVATPLEKQLGKIAGVNQMTSISTLGQTRITLQFDLSRDINGAARDVQAAINASSSTLPTNLTNNPTYRLVNPADAPIMILALTSNVYGPAELYDAASTILQQKISQIDGVGQVYVGGGSLPAVRIDYNPVALSSYSVGLDTIGATIRSQNVNRPKGQLVSGDQASEIATNDQLYKANDYQSLIISYRNNNALQLKDVASVYNSVQDIRNIGIVNSKPGILIVIFKEPGANVIDTTDQISAILPILRASIPKEIKTQVILDRTDTIRASLHDVELTLIIAMILVVIVTYFYLGNFRSMLIPAVCVPLSLLGTFGIMQLCGYSLDNLSLMALTISTGFVVDDAVVVLENTMRHIELGVSPKQAALDGAKEVGFTVLSMSLSLTAVFIPILLMGGIVGRLFREFSVTLAVAILVSMVISLTITPMMCSRLLTTSSHKKRPARFAWILNKYAQTLQWVLQHAWLMLLLTFAAIFLSVFLFWIIPKGFFPQQDTGRIIGTIQADQNSSFQSTEKKLINYIDVIKKDSAVENVAGYVGGSSTVNTGFIFIILKPLSQRNISADDVIVRLRKSLKEIQGANLYLQSAQDITVGGRQAAAQFQYTLSSDSLNVLNTWAPIVTNELRKVTGIADVNSDQQTNGLQVFLNYDRDTASRLGLTVQKINNTLYAAFGQSIISTIYKELNQYRVVLEAMPQYLQNPRSLNDIYINTLNSTEVCPALELCSAPLRVVSQSETTSTLLSVNHQGISPAATLSFNLLPHVALGDAVKNVNDAINNMHLPSEITGSFQGTAEAFQRSLKNEPFLILTALISVYLVLGMLYESYMHPITILSTLPSAGVGAFLALLITHTDFSIISLIGIILLIGIVKKNAIMMIDFALHNERTEKKPPEEAIYNAAILRFRPIMMTTTAAIFGAIPLIIAYGLGSELRRPLGIVIVGGLIMSQMMTVYSTPVIYLWFERLRLWIDKKLLHFVKSHKVLND